MALKKYLLVLRNVFPYYSFFKDDSLQCEAHTGKEYEIFSATIYSLRIFD